MKELLKCNLEEYKETSIELEVSYFLLKESKTLNDGDVISDDSEIVVISNENKEVCGLIGHNLASKKIVWVKSDEINVVLCKKITFDVSELNVIQKIFNGDIF